MRVMTKNNFTPSDCLALLVKSNKVSESNTIASGVERRAMQDSYASRVSGQHLAGTGALVFEGELLEFPQWGSQAA